MVFTVVDRLLLFILVVEYDILTLRGMRKGRWVSMIDGALVKKYGVVDPVARRGCNLLLCVLL